MDKKAGSYLAGTMFFVIFLYFVIFILVVDSTANINDVDSELNVTDFSGTQGNLYQIGYFGQVCNNPRSEYDPNTAEVTESDDPDHLDCEKSRGVLRDDICNSIEGCNWENVTTGFWFWETTEDATCLGTINASYYGIDTTTFLDNEIVASHSNTDTFNDLYGTKKTICNHPNVIRNETLCQTFSCTYDFLQTDTQTTDLGSIKRTAGDVFTFRHDFDVDNSFMSFVLNFVFVILPILGLLIAIYFMLPVIH